MTPDRLPEILQTRFGFAGFRPHQEAVCRAVGQDGRDALVVMPTGAGKSLCYQLPGLVRPGPALVISPLVALIEDQVHRLSQQGGITPIRADRIHASRAREDSRLALGAFLRRELEFLFIAPERLAVPGFAEMLRENPPGLIAVDEAHCISHWGHDFRPDYRLVGERLSQIPGAPIIALTATATPLVQQDICAQLRMREPLRFIHGFRRDDLAVRLQETLPSQRLEIMAERLAEPGRLPAIVYAPTRAKTEEIARALGARFKCAAYHAGMAAPARERVQQDFIHGRLDVIVATIAFGMGIDKADIRTVVHAALPASVEGYYQEIGRAGRDGKPSQALLLHSFSDRKTHEFFFGRDYPETSALNRVYRVAVDARRISREALEAKLPALEPEVIGKALEKLWAHRGVEIDADENISPLLHDWSHSYNDQRNYRLQQLEAMQNFTRAPGCRMLGLIRHFGDPSDSGKPCGVCDRCQPGADLRTLDEAERAIAALVLASLAGRNGQAVGRLFEEAQRMHSSPLARSGFERLLEALAKAQLLDVAQEQFERDGQTISFRRVSLTARGRSAQADAIAAVEIDGPGALESQQPTRARARQKKKAPLSARPAREALDDPTTPSEVPRLFESLRAWRRETARARGLPPFRILSDRVLLALCEQLPRDEASLLGVAGIGPKIVKQYGEALLSAIAAAR